LLEEALRERGITVKRGVEITGLELDGSATDPAAWVTLQGEDEQETIRAAHVLAADGAHSSVRKSLGIGFEGRPMRRPGGSMTWSSIPLSRQMRPTPFF
jgi:2-polyprenyl-6-methoxyphenol hydroxylase-like FAD-dependent oxidoreductase